MPRVALTLEYDGSAYSGWQSQKHVLAVQHIVEQAVSSVANHPVSITAAGRTDSGVHALQQVVHFDSDAERSAYSWVMGTNSRLPADVRVVDASPVPADFHARFSALARFYRYVILNRAARSALRPRQVTWHYRALDIARMSAAAEQLIGEHDFSGFRANGCQSKSPWRRLYLIDVSREGEQIVVDVVANAFLHHMVRNILGVLLEIGDGRRPVEWAGEVLRSRNRVQAGITAPADGLYFGAVLYPARFGLPRHAIFDKVPGDLTRFVPNFVLERHGESPVMGAMAP